MCLQLFRIYLIHVRISVFRMSLQRKINFCGGRYISAEIDLPDGALITEYVPQSHGELKPLRTDRITGGRLPHPIIGFPQIICYEGNLVVVQLLVGREIYIHFLVIDLSAKQYFVFKDDVKHFKPDMLLKGSIQCHLSPDGHCLLLRLPVSVLRPRAASLSLTAKKLHGDEPISAENPVLSTSKLHKFQDRKFKMIAFDPRFPRRLLSMKPNEYCTRCEILVQDLITRSIIFNKTVPLPDPVDLLHRHSAQQRTRCSAADEEVNSNCDSDEEHEGQYYLDLVSCTTEYSRAGDRIVMCCHVAAGQNLQYLRVLIFDSDLFMCIDQHTHKLPSSMDLKTTKPFLISFTPCDSKINVFQFIGNCGKIRYTLPGITIPRNITLQAICRIALLRNLQPGRDLSFLPMPCFFVHYLHFNTYRHHLAQQQK